MTVARLAAPALVLTVLLAGCGAAASDKDSATDFRGDQAAVAKTVETLQSKAKKGDDGGICSQVLAGALAKQIAAHGKDTCENALSNSLRDADSGTFELQVKKVAISGTTATATVASQVSGESDRIDTFRLVKEGTPARWKISALGS